MNLQEVELKPSVSTTFNSIVLFDGNLASCMDEGVSHLSVSSTVSSNSTSSNITTGVPVIQVDADVKFSDGPVKQVKEVILAGPTNPLVSKRVAALQPMKFKDEQFHFMCEWDECTFETNYVDTFMNHVGEHLPFVEVNCGEGGVVNVTLYCKWKDCPWSTEKTSEDLQRHLYLHAYHTKLKCIGSNTLQRGGLNSCRADSSNRNILPDLAENLLCAWGSCCEQFINIQLYYNHISGHVDQTPRGKNVPGGIKCVWTGCTSVFPNAGKLRDHMRSHTQEKLLACPTCGGLFANRTRFFDHCRRQVLSAEQSFACDVCLKCFSTERLLRDHIRSHINSFKCPQCDMSCPSPSALTSHIRYRHSQEKPYPCEVCKYSAKSYYDMVRHTKTHASNEFKCEEEGCSFTCKTVEVLKNHWKRDHVKEKAEARYSCHVCEKRFRKGYYLTKHLIKVHKLQWPSGHSRFRYKQSDDGIFRLLTVRYESVDEPQM